MNFLERFAAWRRRTPERVKAVPDAKDAPQPKSVTLTHEELAAIVERYSSLALAERIASLGMAEREQFERIAALERRVRELRTAIDRLMRGFALSWLAVILAAGFCFAKYFH